MLGINEYVYNLVTNIMMSGPVKIEQDNYPQVKFRNHCHQRPYSHLTASMFYNFEPSIHVSKPCKSVALAFSSSIVKNGCSDWYVSIVFFSVIS